MSATTCAARASARRSSPACCKTRTGSGFRQMFAVIGDSDNVGSIGVHASLGFQRVGVLRASGFKFGRWVDAVYMQRALGRGRHRHPGLTRAKRNRPDTSGSSAKRCAHSTLRVRADHGQHAIERRPAADRPLPEQPRQRKCGAASRPAAGALGRVPACRTPKPGERSGRVGHRPSARPRLADARTERRSGPAAGRRRT